ncbi:Lytic transglycosylase catalytic [Salmonella enterica subsp. enterica serovar Agona str. 40.E.08]|nr:Lytic transglycosylase catalytic [Salmonella enterica subsp. enterica serovar Agona str. 40.E.08]
MKSFLVSLGFDVDGAGAAKFDATIVSATKKAVALGVAVEAAAMSVVAFTTKIASGLDELYWASQRTGATVAGIQAIGYAASQTGSSAVAARNSLESLARFIRTSPGAEGFLNRLGVQTRDASGQMRSMESIFSGVGQRLSSMPYYRANQYASMLGIDENTLMAMRRGMGEFGAQYSATAKAIGFNADAAAKSSNRFMTSMREFTMMAGMARDKIGSSLTDGLAGSLDRLRKQILDNFPKIEQGITAAIKGILWLADAVGRVVMRLLQAAGDISDWWQRLDGDSKKLLETLGAVLVAWRLLNSAMLASPVTWVLALAGALVLLYDDYKTWKEGGKSLIDWSKWQPAIEKAKDAIVWIRDKLLELKDAAGGWNSALEKVAMFIGGAWLTKIMFAHNKLMGLPMPPWLKMWALYAGYIVSDRENIKDSAQSSWDYMKRNAGDALRWLGIDTDMGRQPGTVFGANQQSDLPGGFTPPRPTKAGAQLLGWLQPTMSNLERMYNLPSGILRAVATAESGGDQFATSGAGAQGLFQLMPGTAKDLGLKGNDVFDPVKSADAAARYLGMLLRRSGGNLSKALASYNWGMGNVERYGMGLLPQETRDYIPRVMSNMPGATMNQEVNITVHGVSNPQEAGNIIASKQAGIMANGIQQLQTGPR